MSSGEVIAQARTPAVDATFRQKLSAHCQVKWALYIILILGFVSISGCIAAGVALAGTEISIFFLLLFRTPNSELRTPNSELRTPNSELRTLTLLRNSDIFFCSLVAVQSYLVEDATTTTSPPPLVLFPQRSSSTTQPRKVEQSGVGK
jgi:hypothetical protein